jgi:hypothetical protein
MKFRFFINTQLYISILSLISFVFFSNCSLFEKEKDPITVIYQLKEMSDMAAVEFVVSKVVKVNDVPDWYKIGDRKLLISCKARIKAGINMGEIQEDDIVIKGKSVELRIPHSRIVSLNMDPESIKEEYSKTDFFRSNFTNEDRYSFLAQAEREITESIPQMGVLLRANAHAIAFFESWLRLLGFEEVRVVIKPSGTSDIQP